jgi:TonB family protein
MRITGAVLVMLVVGCAESTPTPRHEGSAASESQSQPDPASVTPERQDAIERLFSRKASDLQACWSDEYEKSHNRKLEGDVTLQLVVDPTGKPGDIKILKSTLGNQPIENCVVTAVGSWAFPEGRASMPVTRTVHLGAQF